METSKRKNSKYDAKYDLVKFILSFLVVAIHANLFPMVLYPWLRIAVPLFFMISSYFLFSKLFCAQKTEHKTILKGFVQRNLALYACWFVILLPITFIKRRDLFFTGNILESILNFLRSLFFGSTFVASWFITASVAGALIVYFLCRILKKDWAVFLVALASYCFVTLASSYMPVVGDTFIGDAVNGYTYVMGHLVCSFPASLLYVFIGKFFAERKIMIKSLWTGVLLTIFFAAALFAEWKFVMSFGGNCDNDSYFMLAPLCVMLFVLIQRIPPIQNENSIHLKRASTIIYVSHGSVMMVISRIFMRFLSVHSELLFFAATIVFCIVLYFLIDLLVKKCPSLKLKKLLKMLY